MKAGIINTGSSVILSLLFLSSLLYNTSADPLLNIDKLSTDSSSATEISSIESFITANKGANWKVALKDQLTALLLIEEDRISLSLLQYDFSFTSCDTPYIENVKLLEKTAKEGNFRLTLLDPLFPYDKLLVELLGGLEGHLKTFKSRNVALVAIIPPEVSYPNHELIEAKLQSVLSGQSKFPNVHTCKDCSPVVTHEEYASHHNRGDSPYELFIGWNQYGLYTAGLNSFLREDYKNVVPTYKFDKCGNSSSYAELRSQNVSTFTYFNPFFSVDQIIEGMHHEGNECFQLVSGDGERKEHARVCSVAVDEYFTKPENFYSTKPAFGVNLNYQRPSVVHIKNQSQLTNDSNSLSQSDIIHKDAKILVESQHLLSLLTYEQGLDDDTDEYPTNIKSILETGQEICEGDYELSGNTQIFDSPEFCLSVLIIAKQLSSIVNDDTREIFIKTQDNIDSPSNSNWVLGALEDQLVQYHLREQIAFTAIKAKATNSINPVIVDDSHTAHHQPSAPIDNAQMEADKEIVYRITVSCLVSVAGIMVLAYIIKFIYIKESSELIMKEK